MSRGRIGAARIVIWIEVGKRVGPETVTNRCKGRKEVNRAPTGVDKGRSGRRMVRRREGKKVACGRVVRERNKD